MTTMYKVHDDGTRDYGHLDDEGDKAAAILDGVVKRDGLFGGKPLSAKEAAAMEAVKAQNAAYFKDTKVGNGNGGMIDFGDMFTHYSDENGRDIGTGGGAFMPDESFRTLPIDMASLREKAGLLANGAMQSAVQSPASNGFGLMNALNHLKTVSTYGVGRLTAPAKAEAKRTAADKYANGEMGQLPLGPGYNMMTHLFQRQGLTEKINAQSEGGGPSGEPKIFTDQPEAVKGALVMMGIYGEKNPGGLPIDISEAKKIFFGDSEISKVKEAEWRQTIEIGDSKIDPKRIRKFVNYDGSLTWEILNQDKTVMSRFTLGDYNGTKVFAQGGYKTFAELLKQAKQKIGPNIQGRFDAIRGMFGG